MWQLELNHGGEGGHAAADEFGDVRDKLRETKRMHTCSIFEIQQYVFHKFEEKISVENPQNPRGKGKKSWNPEILKP